MTQDPSTSPPDGLVNISDFVRYCLHAFNEIISIIEEQGSPEEVLPIVTPWADERGRFRVWMENIGAHQRRRSSLEYRLRDDCRLRDQFIKILAALYNKLLDTKKFLVKDGDSDEDGEVIQETFADDNDPPLQRLHGFIADLIRYLFQMTMAVRRPARSDFLRGGSTAEARAFFPFDVDNIRTKYPRADDRLVDRLAQASIYRRRYLLYRGRHHAKIRQGPDEITTLPAEELSDTIGTTLRSHSSEGDDAASMTAMSLTSFATSWLDGNDFTFPRRPKSGSKGEPFECPFCFHIITAPSRQSWVKHLFDDLRPYVCTYLTCASSDMLYASRHAWISHLQKSHPHSESYSEQCPLCMETKLDRMQWCRHVARHLQELALFVLPPENENEEKEAIEEEDESSSGRETQRSEGETSSEEDLPPKQIRTQSKSSLVNQEEESEFSRPPAPRPEDEAAYGLPIWSYEDQVAFNLNIKELGRDWGAITARMLHKPSRQIHDFYNREIRKGEYGKTLEMMAEEADQRLGRRPAYISSWAFSYLCPFPRCEKVHRDKFSLSDHIATAHPGHAQADRFRLNVETGEVYYDDGPPQQASALGPSSEGSLQSSRVQESQPKNDQSVDSTTILPDAEKLQSIEHPPTSPLSPLPPPPVLDVQPEPDDDDDDDIRQPEGSSTHILQHSTQASVASSAASAHNSEAELDIPVIRPLPPLRPPPPPPASAQPPQFRELEFDHNSVWVSRFEVDRKALEQEHLTFNTHQDQFQILHPLNPEEVLRLKERSMDIRRRVEEEKRRVEEVG